MTSTLNLAWLSQFMALNTTVLLLSWRPVIFSLWRKYSSLRWCHQTDSRRSVGCNSGARDIVDFCTPCVCVYMSAIFPADDTVDRRTYISAHTLSQTHVASPATDNCVNGGQWIPVSPTGGECLDLTGFVRWLFDANRSDEWMSEWCWNLRLPSQ